MKKNVFLITGNMGYVGTTLTKYLRFQYPDASIIGYDTAFFASSIIGDVKFPERNLDMQYFGDLRDFPIDILKNVDTVIHLAAISNDPMGNEFEDITNQINHIESIKLAEKSKHAGVKNFVFASSCSVYGFASEMPKTELDEVNPLTAYAKSKIDTEKNLQKIAGNDFVVTCLRFATACGFNNRIRLDLVLNDFVASAISLNKISILSDGTPHRPLIDVKDMARAIDWASFRSNDKGGDFLVINVGSDSANYTIKELAEYVTIFQNSNSTFEVNPNAAPDKRSYKVNFNLFKTLAPNHQPKMTINDSIKELFEGLTDAGFNDIKFRESNLIRLNILRTMKSKNIINKDLNYN
jgi:nucleoside-diphosphate-sugar epimerase